MRKSLLTLTALACLLAAPTASAAEGGAPQGGGDGGEIADLMALLNTKIVSASNTAEKLSDAPATVIVLTQEDFRQRGYSELSQMLDDLPGMDVVRPYGDTHLKNYWRGFRNEIGEPFLVMVDGIVFNHLYYNTADTPLVTVPISNIDRVEIVYGPASSVYGANAFMGVINVITLKDRAESGSGGRADLIANGGRSGARSSRIADANFFYKNGDFRMTFTGRFDNSFIDTNTNENYEYTKGSYYADRRLWGNVVDNPNLGGAFKSGVRNRSFDLRAYMGSTEVGMQYYLLDTGYGVIYPGDLVQNNAVWARPELSMHLRHTKTFGDNITSTTLVRYRRSDVRNDSFFVDAFENGSTASDYRVEFSWWQSRNHSVSLNQDFDIKTGTMFSLTTGFKYEQKNLQKAYDNPYGALTPVGNVNLGQGSPFFPDQPVDSDKAGNRIVTEDTGIYAQGKLRFDDNNILTLGVRHDKNSVYGGDTTLRAGYVLHLGSWGFKALFGQAYQEPTPRTLYGGWSGSGSNVDLTPEKSDTIELSGSYTTKSVNFLLSLWDVVNKDTITGKKNLGERKVDGLDFHAQTLIPQNLVKQVKLWGYYSHIFKAEEDVLDAQNHKTGSVFIGDLAKNKLWFGATVAFDSSFDATLMTRYVGARETVVTNPIHEVQSYLTADLNLNYTYRGLGIFLKVNNLTDKQYFHPGIRTAASGDTPGSFSGTGGTWVGSGFSYYNSLLPQPGRYFSAGFRLEF